MTTATKTKKISAMEIAKTSYNANIITCNWAVVSWCVAAVEKQHGAKEAARQMKAINRKREKIGKYTNIPDYGTDLFSAYFAS